MTQSPHSHGSAPSPAELRAQVEETRRELGETVEALAARADIKHHGQRKAAELKARARHAGETTRGGTALPVTGGAALVAVALFLRHTRRKQGGTRSSSPAIRRHAAGGRGRCLGGRGLRAGLDGHRPGGGSTRRHRPGQRPA
ncbi:DUF3618 domain-containing protein [Streptomyces sp. NPDC006925]|uniref:DUF3618 domain-containing protein n=1 Tax=Streptomyces sp. NPDC006925 TaxID=3364768 RepID=UPI0036AF661F